MIDPMTARLQELRAKASYVVQQVRLLPTETIAALDSLRPGTNYSIRLAARNIAGWSDWGSALDVSTLAASSPPQRCT